MNTISLWKVKTQLHKWSAQTSGEAPFLVIAKSGSYPIITVYAAIMWQSHSLVPRPLPVFNVTRKKRFFLRVTLKTGSGLGTRLAITPEWYASFALGIRDEASNVRARMRCWTDYRRPLPIATNPAGHDSGWMEPIESKWSVANC